MSLNEALAVVKAAGFNVSKPRAKKKRAPPTLNALGLSMSPLYDPNYKIKHKSPGIARLLKPMPANTPWVKPTGTMTAPDQLSAEDIEAMQVEAADKALRRAK